MTTSDWARIRQDTERAIERMKRLLEWAEVGKKKERANKGDKAE